MRERLRAFVADERGATAIEYGLIAALIAIAAIVGMTTMGAGLQSVFSFTSNKATSVWDNAMG